MIEKYFRIDAAAEDVLAELLDINGWTDWWHEVVSLKVVKEEDARSQVELVFRPSISVRLTLDIEHANKNLIRFKQVTGWFKAYAGDWAILPDADDSTCVLRMRVHIDGGVLIPRRMLLEQYAKSLDRFGEALRQRLGHTAGRRAKQQPDMTEEYQKEISIHLFRLKNAIEVWSAGKLFVVKSG